MTLRVPFALHWLVAAHERRADAQAMLQNLELTSSIMIVVACTNHSLDSMRTELCGCAHTGAWAVQLTT